MPQRIPGKLDIAQVYNDSWRGWPVRPLHRQHPIRGSFLDPRPDPELGAVYHDGIDVAVRDDRPERGAPAGRTHRVYAIEGGPVFLATPRGARGFARVGHFGYGHIDPVVQTGETVAPGQHIGWTCEGDWHVHLSEFVFTSGRPLVVNPLRPGGKVHPYVDDARPEIREIRFHAPATPAWTRRPTTSVARLPQAGTRMPRDRLFGQVDVRVRVSDPQSFIGWFEELPWLAAPHHPFRLAVEDRPRRHEPARSSPRGIPGGAGPRSAGRPPLRAGNGAEPAGWRMHAAPRIAQLRRRVLVSALPALLGYDPSSATGDTTSEFARGTSPATSRTPTRS